LPFNIRCKLIASSFKLKAIPLWPQSIYEFLYLFTPHRGIE
jgi:hypothetical protein